MEKGHSGARSSRCIIDAQGVSKVYRTGPILENVSTRLHEGEVLLVLGPNGAGKSTLLQCLTGLKFPTSGQVHLCGIPLTRKTRVGEILGVHTATMGFETGISGYRHLKMLDAFRTGGGSDVERLLDSFGLARASKSSFGRFSTGMKQKLGLAAAALGSPLGLVLDEPLSGLDRLSVDRFVDFLASYRSSGGCAIVVSHQIEELLPLSTHVSVIDRSVIWSGTTEAFTQDGALDGSSAYRNIVSSERGQR